MPKTDREILAGYIPENSIDTVLELIVDNNINLNIKNARSTKLGDFRPATQEKPARLSINADLNSYAFLITLIHEIAHWLVWKSYKNYRTLAPHGIEWKRTFSGLMTPFLNNTIFPEDILLILKKHMSNPKATTTSDVNLMKVLKKYDEGEQAVILADLNVGDSFLLKGKQFQIIKKNRSRYLCGLNNSSKKFLIHSLAEIILAE